MPRGRPRQFDETQVLDVAARLFRRDGYEAVGMAQLGDAAGVPVQSLYNTFGDKAALFRRVMERFGEAMNDPQIAALEAAVTPGESLAVLREYVMQWRRHRRVGPEGGCLFTQTLCRSKEVPGEGASDSPEGIARRYTARLRRALAAAATRAASGGLLPPDPPPRALADTLLTLSFGVAVLGRGGLPGPVVDHAVRQALTLLTSPSDASRTLNRRR